MAYEKPSKSNLTLEEAQRRAMQVPPSSQDDTAQPRAKKSAKPPRPVKRCDAEDIERADSEGMGQPQSPAS
jgi:hypothetical protein